MTEAKVKIDLATRSIELQGSESFVRHYLDEFKALIEQGGTPPKTSAPTQPSGTDSPIGSKRKPEKKAAKKTPATVKRAAKKVQAERFEIHGDNDTAPPLESFFNEKRPGSANDQRVAVIGYYINEMLHQEYFSEGQIEYAYKMLKLDRPGNLHQILLNGKNRKDLFSPDPEDNTRWMLTRAGDILVADKLPNNED